MTLVSHDNTKEVASKTKPHVYQEKKNPTIVVITEWEILSHWINPQMNRIWTQGMNIWGEYRIRSYSTRMQDKGPKLSTRKEKMITGKGRRGPKLFHPVRVRNLGHFQPGPLCGRATDKTLHWDGLLQIIPTLRLIQNDRSDKSFQQCIYLVSLMV